MPLSTLPSAPPTRIPGSWGRRAGLLAGTLAVFSLLALGCRGGGDAGKPAPVSLTLQPGSVRLYPGQTQQFEVLPASPGPLLWSVDPPDMGSVDAQGLFTASQAGNCRVRVVLASDPRAWSLALVEVLTAPPGTGEVPPDQVLASGQGQAGASGAIANHAVIGEGLAGTSSDGSGFRRLRHGFIPTATAVPSATAAASAPAGAAPPPRDK